MFFVKYGDKYLHDPRVGLILPLTQPSVELNSSTEFKFQVAYGHELYDTIRERDSDNPVIVYQDNMVVYKGEIIDISLDFELNKEVTCKSDLGYLNQIPTRPYSTSSAEYSRTCPTTLRDYFEFLINEYNDQASVSRKFKIGINQGANLDSRFDNYYSDSSYTSVGSTIKENIIEEVGGYVRIRYDGEDSYIDFLSDMPDVNAQVIDFGKNLLDFVKDDDSDGVYSFVIPLGKQVEKESDDSEELSLNLPISSAAITYLQREVDSTYADLLEAEENEEEARQRWVEETDPERKQEYYEQYLEAQERTEEAQEDYDYAVSAKTDADTATIDRTIEDGYKKSGDLIYSEKAVSRYGWIGTTADFSDIGIVSELISYGLIYLKSLESPVTTIECTALDLSMLKPNLKPIKLGDYVRVRSKPHGIDSYYLVSKIDYDLNDPSNNLFTLGTTFDTLTGQQNKRINALNKTINTVYEAADKLSAETKAAAITAGEAQATAEEAQTIAEGAQSTAESAIISVTDEFIVTNSSSVVPSPSDPGWSSTTPTHTQGTYIWKRSVVEYGDETETTSDPVCITGNTGEDGADGADGADGEDGVGISSIVEYYAISTSNSVAPSSWQTTPVPTMTDTYKYLWTYETITYTDSSTTDTSARVIGTYGDKGEQGNPGADGADGADGDDGVSVTSVTRYYCLSASQPAKPTTSNPGGSWTTTEPQYTPGSTNNLYFVDKTMFSDNTFSYSDVSLSSSYAASKQAYDKANTTKQELDTYKTNHTLTDNQINTSINGVASDLTELSTTVEGVQMDLETNYSTKTEVSQTAASIRSEVAEEFEDYSTTVQMNSAIDQKAGEITSSVASTYSTKSEAQGYATNAVDNLELGGRNLLVLSKSERYNNPTTSWNGIAISSPDEEGWFTVSGTTTGSGAARALTLWGVSTNAPNEFLPKEGGTYQLTVEYTPGTFKTGSLYTNSSHIVMYYDTNNRRVAGYNPDTITAEVPNYIYRIAYYIGIDVPDGTTLNGKFRLKLEKGNKQSAWSPASEDVLYTSETQLTQTSEEIRMDFASSISTASSDLQNQIQAGDALATTKFSEINRYIRFVNGQIVLGETGNELMLTISNNRVSFTQGGVEVAYFSNNNLYIKRAEVLTTLKVGNYEFAPRNDGGLALKKIRVEEEIAHLS